MSVVVEQGREGLTERVVGGLAGAIIGDALGAHVEFMTHRAIIAEYGWFDHFLDVPLRSPFAGGRQPGSFTDDASQMLELVYAFIDNGGVSVDAALNGILNWARDPEMVRRFAGPTTRIALQRLRDGDDPADVGRGNIHNIGSGITNGAAMKAAPGGWFATSFDEAVLNGVKIATPTHFTQIGAGSAAAIAAATWRALDATATIDQVVEAAIEGARQGEAIGLREGREAPGSSLPARIEAAVEIARDAPDLKSAVHSISDRVGSSVYAIESVPAAIALFRAANGDVKQTAIACANVGDDTDSVGCMATAIAGTFGGRKQVPNDWYDLISRTNNVNLPDIATKVVAVAHSV